MAGMLAKLAEREMQTDRLLTTRQLAERWGRSRQWLEAMRISGGGPPFIRISSRCIRYHPQRALEWLRERERTQTDGTRREKAKPKRKAANRASATVENR
jgi:predicted DNA-binding transcriptional regulator AlpA